MIAPYACHACQKPLAEGLAQCPNCEAKLGVPDCPECGKPVANAESRKSTPSYRVDPSWNTDWDGRCVSCGHEFAARVELRTGHHTFFENQLANEPRGARPAAHDLYSGVSQLEICGGESVYMRCDEWDHQPTIEISVRRAVAANAGSRNRGALEQNTRVTLTHAECLELVRQLAGPLAVLLRREPWSEDTT